MTTPSVYVHTETGELCVMSQQGPLNIKKNIYLMERGDFYKGYLFYNGHEPREWGWEYLSEL